jgi:hypothetical protein
MTSNAAIILGHFARGRVLLAFVFRYHSSGRSAMVMFCMNHIQRTGLQVDSPESFQHTWTVVMSELTATPYPAVNALSCSLADVTASYKRAKPAHDSSDHLFEFLFEAASRYIRMKREEQLSPSLPGNHDRIAFGIYPQ